MRQTAKTRAGLQKPGTTMRGVKKLSFIFANTLKFWRALP
jgi:hypothetical protein